MVASEKSSKPDNSRSDVDLSDVCKDLFILKDIDMWMCLLRNTMTAFLWIIHIWYACDNTFALTFYDSQFNFLIWPPPMRDLDYRDLGLYPF